MPIVIYASSSKRLERVQSALRGRRVEVFTGEHGARVFREARCLVWATRRRDLDRTVDLLTIVTRRHPEVPVIIVTDDRSHAAIALSSIPLHAVSEFVGLSETLPGLVRDAIARSWFERVAKEVSRSNLRPLLARAIALAMIAGARSPFRSASELAKEVGCSPDTLARALREAVQGTYRLSDLLSAIQVVRAVMIRNAGTSWASAAGTVNCHYESLRAKSKRWPGGALRHLDAREPARLFRVFEEDFIRALVTTARVESTPQDRAG